MFLKFKNFEFVLLYEIQRYKIKKTQLTINGFTEKMQLQHKKYHFQ